MTSLVLKDHTKNAPSRGKRAAKVPRTAARRRRLSLRPGVIVAWIALVLLAPFLVRGLGVANVDAAVSQTTVRSITALADDVRTTESGELVTDEPVTSIGAGAGAHPTIAGFRFTNLRVPTGAIVEAVHFSLVKVQTGRTPLRVDLAFEAADSAASFSDQAPPGSRVSTGAVLALSEDRQMVDGRRYTLGDPTKLALSLREVVARPGWHGGNSVVLIAYGPLDPAWTRSTFATFDAGPAHAPQLTVMYRVPSASAAAKK
jgi:hypothetical protein